MIRLDLQAAWQQVYSYDTAAEFTSENNEESERARERERMSVGVRARERKSAGESAGETNRGRGRLQERERARECSGKSQRTKGSARSTIKLVILHENQ